MMAKLLVLILIQCVAAPAFAKHTAHGCKLYVYPVSASGQVARQPIISPKQVASVRYDGVDRPTGMGIWRIVLTPEGAAANAEYTKSHLGGKVAVTCGAVAVGQFAVQAPSSASFIISSNELGP